MDVYTMYMYMLQYMYMSTCSVAECTRRLTDVTNTHVHHCTCVLAVCKHDVLCVLHVEHVFQ